MDLFAKTPSRIAARLLHKNVTIISISSQRQFNYDHWYKTEKEKERRIRKKTEEMLKDKSLFDLAKLVGKEAFSETCKFMHETKNQYEESFKLPIEEHGAFNYLFKFNTAQDLEKWHVTTDASYKIGKSSASLTLTERNTALFSGYISSQFDKPERTRAIYTGFANMSSITKMRSFKREERLDLRPYTHFLIRARGDGRAYMIILNTPDYFTLTFTYMHSYPFYTRGGPYWQWAKIPFSKFFHVSHSRISDRQFRFLQNRVRNIGITCMDGVEGPFYVELDFIGVVRDHENREEFAYETYRVPNLIVNT